MASVGILTDTQSGRVVDRSQQRLTPAAAPETGTGAALTRWLMQPAGGVGSSALLALASALAVLAVAMVVIGLNAATGGAAGGSAVTGAVLAAEAVDPKHMGFGGVKRGWSGAGEVMSSVSELDALKATLFDELDAAIAAAASGGGSGGGSANSKDTSVGSFTAAAKAAVEGAGVTQWSIITSIHSPTAAVYRLAMVPNWCVVVAADKKTPANWWADYQDTADINTPEPGAAPPNPPFDVGCLVYLSAEDQEKLSGGTGTGTGTGAGSGSGSGSSGGSSGTGTGGSGGGGGGVTYATAKHVPWRSYGRKNVAYMWAIDHGARTIYESDDDNVLLTAAPEPQPTPTQMLTYNSTHDAAARRRVPFVNPYAYFGEPSVWPRGYPLEAIGDGLVRGSASLTDPPVTCEQRPVIQQGLANGDPDVDAVYRLTRKVTGIKVDIKFEDKAAVAIPPGTFVPFNAQNTFWHYDSFWALPLPVTVNFRVCDIWRAYFSERLMWELDGTPVLAFLRATVYQDRNAHDYLVDYKDESEIYDDVGRLIAFLRQWQVKADGADGTPQHRTFFHHVLQLAYDWADNGFWGAGDVRLIRAFLVDLLKRGYKPPALAPRRVPLHAPLSIALGTNCAAAPPVPPPASPRVYTAPGMQVLTLQKARGGGAKAVPSAKPSYSLAGLPQCKKDDGDGFYWTAAPANRNPWMRDFPADYEYSDFHCSGGSQEVTWGSQWNTFNDDVAHKPIHKVCLLRNVCLIKGVLTFYQDQALTGVPEYARYGHWGNNMLRTGALSELDPAGTFVTAVVNGPRPKDVPLSPRKLWIVDGPSESHNFENFISETLTPAFYAMQMFNLPPRDVQMLVYPPACDPVVLPKSFGPGAGTGPRGKPKADECRDMYARHIPDVFGTAPVWAKDAPDMCLTRAVVGHGGVFAMYQQNTARASIARNMRDFLFRERWHLPFGRDQPKPLKQRVVVLLATKEYAAGTPVAWPTACDDTKAAASKYPAGSVEVECVEPAGLSWRDIAVRLQRATVMVSAHGRVDYLSFLAPEGSVWLARDYVKERHAPQLLVFYAHVHYLYVQQPEELGGLLALAMTRAAINNKLPLPQVPALSK